MTTGRRYLGINTSYNGAAEAGQSQPPGNPTLQTVSTFDYLNQGDYAEAVVAQDSASANLSVSADRRSYFSMFWVGPVS